MAEQVIVVCDVCGEPAQETVRIRVGTRGYAKDLCSAHLGEMLQGARTSRRGRPRATAQTGGAPKTAATRRRRKTATARKKVTSRRRRSRAAAATAPE